MKAQSQYHAPATFFEWRVRFYFVDKQPAFLFMSKRRDIIRKWCEKHVEPLTYHIDEEEVMFIHESDALMCFLAHS